MRNDEYLEALLDAYKKASPEKKKELVAEMQAELATAAHAAADNPHGLREDLSIMDVESGKSFPMAPHHYAAVKTLGNSLPDAAEYLSRNMPDAKFGIYNGQIYAKDRKGKEEEPWQPIGLSVDQLADKAGNVSGIGDAADLAVEAGKSAVGVIDPALAGVAQGVGSVIGAVTGAATTLNPAGALAGSAAGSALANTGYEYLRQGLGRLAGVNKGFDHDKVMNDGKWALATPLMGTGVGSLAKPMMTKNAIESMVQKLAAAKSIPASEIRTWGTAKILDEAGKTAYGGVIPAIVGTGGEVGKGLISTVTGTKPSTVDFVMENGGKTSRVANALVPNQQTMGPGVAQPFLDTVNAAAKGQKKGAKRALDAATRDIQFSSAPLEDTAFDNWLKANATRRMEAPGTVDRALRNRAQNNVMQQIMELEHLANAGMLDGDAYQHLLNKYNRDINWKKATALAPPPPDKSLVLGEKGKTASALKKALTSTAETGRPQLTTAREGYSQMVDDLSQVSKTTKGATKQDYSKVMSTVAAEGEAKNALDNWAERTMSPADYKKYIDGRNELGANLDYHGAKDSVFTPTGSMSMAGAPGAMIAKGVRAKPFFDIAVPIGGMMGDGVAALRNVSPYAQGFVRELNYTPVNETLSEEQKKKNKSKVIDAVSKLGAQ